MKNTPIGTLSCIILLSALLSCKKNEAIITKPVEVNGKWNWIFTTLVYPDPQTGSSFKQTPLNSGNTESMEFEFNKVWRRKVNTIVVDSGTYTLEHLQYISSTNIVYNYDKLNYFRNGSILGEDYYEMRKDTLVFNPTLRGFYTSLNVPVGSGSKYFLKQ